MSCVFPILPKHSRPQIAKGTPRSSGQPQQPTAAIEAIPIPPSVLPPSPPVTPPNSSDKESETDNRTEIRSSTPYTPTSNRSRKTRRASPFPLLIPSELTLSIVRQGPLTAFEEFTCKDYEERVDGHGGTDGSTDASTSSNVDGSSSSSSGGSISGGSGGGGSGGKEDSVSSSRIVAAPITKEQCRGYGTPRETSAAVEVCTSREVTMGACTSKSSSRRRKQMEKPPSVPIGPKIAAEPPDDASMDEEEEPPPHLPKFKLKRDSIAVTKVRMMRTQIHQEHTIGEEDELDEQNDLQRRDDHVHFDNEVTKQSIPNDSGVSLDSCPETDFDLSSIKFKEKCDSPKEISLASNITIRSMRRDNVFDNEQRSFNFETIRERTKRLLENQLKPQSPQLERSSPSKRP